MTPALAEDFPKHGAPHVHSEDMGLVEVTPFGLDLGRLNRIAAGVARRVAPVDRGHLGGGLHPKVSVVELAQEHLPQVLAIHVGESESGRAAPAIFLCAPVHVEPATGHREAPEGA